MATPSDGTGNDTGATAEPQTLRILETPAAASLAALSSTFEDLQTVLQCCERLVTGIAAAEPDAVAVEGLWTLALVSYGRCFAEGDAHLTESDLEATKSHEEAVKWHRVLLHLRDHYLDPAVNPRERFTVGVAQDASGAPGGVGISSIRQPLVDDLTVRQAGAIAFALSGLVDDRIAERQQQVYDEVRAMSAEQLADLDQLPVSVAG